MAGGVVAEVAASVFGLITAVMNFFTNMFLTPPLSATIKHLEEAELKTLTGEPKTIRAKSLWETSGAVIMAEAAELSSLKPQLDELGVPLYAVVKEDIGTEVQNFRPYLKGEIFLDEKVVLFSCSELVYCVVCSTAFSFFHLEEMVSSPNIFQHNSVLQIH
ncbi:redox-regulatory protein FAM213A-like [Solea senegalensis]|uniref:Peroxiredoxin-like 2A n=1 Tax=Solea senegalensis TaxID=28829 RepID=A0AAV6RPR2_SOLSE|nr:redox-regulatory protein FAM213A-like [Solea senegalensis]